MKLDKKYIKCFNQKKSAELQEAGFSFLFEQAGVYYHKNDEQTVSKFSSDNDNSNILKDTKYSAWIPL